MGCPLERLVRPQSRERLAYNLGMAPSNANERLRGTGWRPTPLLPFLERALGDAQGLRELRLRQAGSLACLRHLVRLHRCDARRLGGLHFANGLQKLQTQSLA